jgi:hypothetical protein
MCNGHAAQCSARPCCAPEPQQRIADTDVEPAADRSLVTGSVEEAFDLGVAGVLFILQGADVVADERVDAVTESACRVTKRQTATQPHGCGSVVTVVNTERGMTDRRWCPMPGANPFD